jgi:hypothetical protein
MTDNQEVAPSASETGSQASRRASSRRMLLRGSLVAAPTILTLKSRPVLASGRTCSPSAFMSKNPSVPLERACGDSPGCWKSKNFDKWSEYTGGLYQHGTSLSATFSAMAQTRTVTINGQTKTIPRCSFKIGSTPVSDLTLVQCINVVGDVFVEAIKDGVKTSVRAIEVSNGFQLQIVAGILNGAFYGDTYVLGGDDRVISLVNDAIVKASTVPSTSSLGPTDWVKSVLDPVTAQLDMWNNQGTICPTI